MSGSVGSAMGGGQTLAPTPQYGSTPFSDITSPEPGSLAATYGAAAFPVESQVRPYAVAGGLPPNPAMGGSGLLMPAQNGQYLPANAPPTPQVGYPAWTPPRTQVPGLNPTSQIPGTRWGKPRYYQPGAWSGGSTSTGATGTTGTSGLSLGDSLLARMRQPGISGTSIGTGLTPQQMAQILAGGES